MSEKSEKKNVSASIKQKLLNHARQTNLERSKSPYKLMSGWVTRSIPQLNSLISQRYSISTRLVFGLIQSKPSWLRNFKPW